MAKRGVTTSRPPRRSMSSTWSRIVTTSNFHPDGLYPNGLHRERILPAIELLKQHMEILNVDAGHLASFTR